MTKIRSSFEFRQFEIGTSTRRYFPASGTAGLARSRVSGKSRVPAPPPRMTASTRSMTVAKGKPRELVRQNVSALQAWGHYDGCLDRHGLLARQGHRLSAGAYTYG